MTETDPAPSVVSPVGPASTLAAAAVASGATAEPAPPAAPVPALEIIHNNTGQEIRRWFSGNLYILKNGENLIQDLVHSKTKALIHTAKEIADHLWEQGWTAGVHMSPGVERESRKV